MATMGRYCKAYPAERFKEFAGWLETAPAPAAGDATGDAADGDALDLLYLHENLTVTRGVFLDEEVVFSGGDAQWEAFCRTTLAFEVPDFARDAE